MRARIINTDYAYIINTAGHIGITLASESRKPWQATTRARTRRFRTHAQAIRWANKQVRKGKK